jgi:hypothetical protein
MNEHLKLLGLKAQDKVTGFSGVITSICFDLYGCVQAIVTPPNKENKVAEETHSRWFDTKRLKILNKNPVLRQPDFANVPGGARKPLPVISQCGTLGSGKPRLCRADRLPIGFSGPPPNQRSLP